jgi:hypothetical protein
MNTSIFDKNEFALSKGSFGQAFLCVVRTAVSFIILPLCIFALMDGVMDVAVANGMFGTEMFERMTEVSEVMLKRAIKYSLPFLIIAIPMGFYPSGNAAKIPFRLIFAAYMIIWIWVITGGGVIFAEMGSMSISGGLSIDSIGLTMNVTNILYITLMIAVAKGFLAFSEYGSHREKYLEELYKKEKKRRKVEESL